MRRPAYCGTLREAPLPPQPSLVAVRFPSLDLENQRQIDSQKILGWLQATMGVFLSAASSSDFFVKAAQAVVDVVGLDSWPGHHSERRQNSRPRPSIRLAASRATPPCKPAVRS